MTHLNHARASIRSRMAQQGYEQAEPEKRKQKRTPKETPAAYAQRTLNNRLRHGPPSEPVPTVFASPQIANPWTKATCFTRPLAITRHT